MDDKAQIGFEYLVLVSIVIVIASIVIFLSQNYIATSETVRETGKQYSEKTLEMMEGLK
ncbi:MAG: class III signal peptide-containing protein [archaeon]